MRDLCGHVVRTVQLSKGDELFSTALVVEGAFFVVDKSTLYDYMLAAASLLDASASHLWTKLPGELGILGADSMRTGCNSANQCAVQVSEPDRIRFRGMAFMSMNLDHI